MPWQAFLMVCMLVMSGATLAQSSQVQLPPEQVNINTADAETLALVLEGVGPAKARAIVEYRESNGGFGSVEDLLQVRGIGQRTLEANAGRIKVAD